MSLSSAVFISLLFTTVAFGTPIPVTGFGEYSISEDGTVCGGSVTGPGISFNWGEELPFNSPAAPLCDTGRAGPSGSVVTGTASIDSISSDYFVFGVYGGAGSLTLYDSTYTDVLADADLTAYYYASPPTPLYPGDPYDFYGSIVISIYPIPEPRSFSLFIVGLLLSGSLLAYRGVARG